MPDIVENEDMIFEAVEMWMAKNNGHRGELLGLVHFNLMSMLALDILITCKAGHISTLALQHS